MTAAVALSPSRPVVARRTPVSFPAQAWLEARKSMSTRSGLALVGTSALFAPVAVALVSASADRPLTEVTGPIVISGMLSVLVLLAMGVLSTAGEWSNGSVQTTYLLTPRRGRVLAAKSVAVAAIGAVVAAVAAGLSAGVLALMEPSASWAGAGRGVAMIAVAGAVFALIGAGVGAALGNTAAALTGVYLVNLGVMPLLETFKPALAHKVDPGNAVLSLAQGDKTAVSIAILAGWVAVSLVAGAIMTHRRPVQ